MEFNIYIWTKHFQTNVNVKFSKFLSYIYLEQGKWSQKVALSSILRCKAIFSHSGQIPFESANHYVKRTFYSRGEKWEIFAEKWNAIYCDIEIHWIFEDHMNNHLNSQNQMNISLAVFRPSKYASTFSIKPLQEVWINHLLKMSDF